jgi:hypothetical protein
MWVHILNHLAFSAGLLYGIIGLAIGDLPAVKEPLRAELRCSIECGEHLARLMCMVAWPVLGFGLVTEGEKRP